MPVRVGGLLSSFHTQHYVPRCRYNRCGLTAGLRLARVKRETHTDIMLVCGLHGGDPNEREAQDTGGKKGRPAAGKRAIGKIYREGSEFSH